MKNIVLVFLIFSLFSCNEQKSQQLPESEVIAVVGNEVVTADLLKAYLQANGIFNADENITNRSLDTLIEEVAMANIATKKKLPLTTKQLNTLKYLQLRSMANNAKQDYLLDNIVTEAEIHQEYNKANKQTGGIQFHVHHLLYKDEVQAIKEHEKITSVDDYSALEQAFLQENPNMKGVGDLGWVTLGQLPKSFREVLPASKENTVLNQVLNSKFGAHIVFLEAVRTLQPPKFEDVKQGIVKSIKAKKISKFIQLAKAKAHVIIKE
ncbi:MAG: peptidyl-prolyl cis-trans isomerase [Alcanivoracaceae bacterium]|nr:peptidyl-prolyl cis-trans isomerase [Alcanivoracaceae bacterium]